MGRYDSRIRRLERRSGGNREARWRARLDRMRYDELMSELTKAAVKCGMPEEVAKGDPEAAEDWLGEYLQVHAATLDEDVR